MTLAVFLPMTWDQLTRRKLHEIGSACLPSYARSAVVSALVIPSRLRNLDDSIVAGVGDIDVTCRIECDPFGPDQSGANLLLGAIGTGRRIPRQFDYPVVSAVDDVEVAAWRHRQAGRVV